MKVRLTESKLRRLVESTARRVLREYYDEPGWLLPDPNEQWDESWIEGTLEGYEFDVCAFGIDMDGFKNYPSLWTAIVNAFPTLKQYEQYIPYLSLWFLINADVYVDEGYGSGLEVNDIGLQGDEFGVREGVEETEDLLDIRDALNSFLSENEKQLTKVIENWANSDEDYLSDINDKYNFAEAMAEKIQDARDDEVDRGAEIAWERYKDGE